jgi:bifunctional UDP-N-acetylglucosamine pyrophosphorylase/glucosamine-1-phosphate N-acetyltransferase
MACSDTEEPSRVSASGPAAVIILAAGEGTRMKTAAPKMLHEVCGRTMLDHVLAAAGELRPGRLIVVVSDRRGPVAAHLAEHAPQAEIVVQERGTGWGTGHAVRTALEAVGGIGGTVVVTYSDTPLLRAQTLMELVSAQQAGDTAVTMLAARTASPTGYGRVVRDESGAFVRIVEEADATGEQRAITEINTGMYAFDGDLLADAVKRVPTDNAKGEEYLTDAVTILRSDGYGVGTVWCQEFTEVLGVNDQAQLAFARRVLNDRLLDSWMGAGVTIMDPASTWIDVGVALESGAQIGPGTQLEGRTAVASGAQVGPGSLLRDTEVAAGARVIKSVCESAYVGAGVTVGPFAHLTPGTRLGPGEPAAGPAGGSPAGASLADGEQARGKPPDPGLAERGRPRTS